MMPGNESHVRLLVMDVDGTLTDGKIYIGIDGEAVKAFDVKDGYGIHDLLPLSEITPVIITARRSAIVDVRCRELGIRECYQGCTDKLGKLREIAERYGIERGEGGIYREIAYIGDDINDMVCMRCCGVTGCPADAADEIRRTADFISSKNGGAGAVREFIEWLGK